MSPQKVATELFGPKHTSLKKVAIATRWWQDDNLQAYINAFQDHGFEVRSMQGHTAMEDFCTMLHATEVVGTVRSTFAVWAGLLGDGTARLYSVESPETVAKAAQNGRPYFRRYNWTHPDLQRQVKFELFRSEARVNQLLSTET